MEGKLYRVAFKFKGQIVVVVEFRGSENLPTEELEGILREQSAIMKGERVGVIKEWT